jgi:hypothetical protein
MIDLIILTIPYPGNIDTACYIMRERLMKSLRYKL